MRLRASREMLSDNLRHKRDDAALNGMSGEQHLGCQASAWPSHCAIRVTRFDDIHATFSMSTLYCNRTRLVVSHNNCNKGPSVLSLSTNDCITFATNLNQMRLPVAYHIF